MNTTAGFFLLITKVDNKSRAPKSPIKAEICRAFMLSW